MLVKINKYREEFHRDIAEKRLKFGLYIAIIEFIVFPVLIYVDMNLPGATSEIYFIRAIPLIGVIPFFVILAVKKMQTPLNVTVIYGVNMISNTIMMIFLMDYYLFSPYLQAIIIGFIVISFIIFFYAFSGIKYLFIVLILPFFLFIGYIALFRQAPYHIMITFINPVVMLMVMGISVEYLYSLRYNEFKNRMDLEVSNGFISKKNTVYEQELTIARHFINTLLPEIPQNYKKIRIAVLYEPMMDIGGDMYEFITDRDRNELGIILSDVTGHGVAASIVSSMFKTLISIAGDDRLKPALLFDKINKRLSRVSKTHFITSLMAVINQKNMTLTYSNGGHCLPILIRDDEYMPLYVKGRMLGISEDCTFNELTIDILPGDRIFFYTDGLSEARNSANELYESVMIERIKKYKDNEIESFLRFLYEDVQRYTKSPVFEDDICLVCVDIL